MILSKAAFTRLALVAYVGFSWFVEANPHSTFPFARTWLTSREAVNAQALSKGNVCGSGMRTDRSAPEANCGRGLLCVITSFRRSGTFGVCEMHPEKSIPLCSVPTCSKLGALALCKASSGTSRGKASSSSLSSSTSLHVTRCFAWATRTDGGAGPSCSELPACGRREDRSCKYETQGIAGGGGAVDNFGNVYCTKCDLRRVSCLSNFHVHFRLPSTCAHASAKPCCKGLGSWCRGLNEECRYTSSGVWKGFCAPGSTCVADRLGPDGASGKCRLLKHGKKLPRCSVKWCANVGENGLCESCGTEIVVTCKAWALREDGKKRVECGKFSCAKRTACGEELMVTDNFGKRYCNLCELRNASCKSAFKVHRRSDGEKKVGRRKMIKMTMGAERGMGTECKKDGMKLSVAQRARCCAEHSVHCAGIGERCSTTRVETASVARQGSSNSVAQRCAKGLICVLFDFGVSQAEARNQGECRLAERVGKVQVCSVETCVKEGAQAECMDADTKDIGTCEAYALRRDGRGPRCAHICKNERCDETRNGNQKKSARCQWCSFAKKSCESGFVIHGSR